MIVTASSPQLVGQSLALQCNVTAVSAITGGVVIVWRRDDTVLVGAGGGITSPTAIMGGSVVYTDTYVTQPLSLSDNGVVYQCEVMGSDPLASDSITLAVVGELQ